MGGITGVVALDLQQFDFAAQRSEISLLGGIGLAEIGDFIAAGFKLSVETVLGHLCHGQAFLQQRDVSLCVASPALQLPGQRQQRQRRTCQTEQDAGQVHRHRDSCRSDKT